MRYLPPILLVISLLAAACGDAPLPAAQPTGGDHVTTTEHALGVPKDGFPNWEERVILTLTNRARCDPSAESSGSSYPPTKPLVHNHDLGRAARFQATSLKKAGAGLQHESVCKLVSNLADIYPGKCDGDPKCACEGSAASCSCSGGKPYCSCPGGACTSTWGRIGLFGVSGSGENAAAGSSDPVSTFRQWVKSSGHWSNINKSSHGQLGAGHYGGGGKGCWKDFWVQVFSYGSTTPRLPGGAHHPQGGGPGAAIKFWANYHDPAGAPTAATVNIGGTCIAMTLERGSKQSGTYLTTHSFSKAACHRYYFVFKTASGQRITFPTSGSYGVGISSSNCPDYSASRPNLGSGCGGCSKASDCSDGSPCTTDTCSAGKCKHSKIQGCCTADSQCNDKDVCTTDRCNKTKHRCVFTRKPSCGPKPPAPDSGVAPAPDSTPVGGDSGQDPGPAAHPGPIGDGQEMQGGCVVGGGGGGFSWLLLLLVLAGRRNSRGG